MSTFAAPASPTTGLAFYDLEGAEGGSQPGGLVTKQEADYVSRAAADPCHTCVMFKPPNACTLVMGKINPGGHCKFYAASTKVNKIATNAAAGIVLALTDGRMLFVKRSADSEVGETWGIPGGMIESGETALEAVKRELQEECGFDLPPGDLREVVTIDGPVIYTTFFQRLDDEFEPTLNAEHTAFRWAQPDKPPLPLHPGLAAALAIITSEVTAFTMKAQGAMETTLFVPLTKVDVAQRMVYGTAVAEEPDHTDEIFDYQSSKPHFEDWSASVFKDSGGKSLGNVRAMHGKVAAGKLVDVEFDDRRKAIDVAAKIVDHDEWKKVEEGVYTGFSIGGKYAKKWRDGVYTRYTAIPSEVSLVDRPCIRNAVFTMVKMDGSRETRRFQEAATVSKVITNDLVVKRATALAREAGDETAYADFLYGARQQLEAEAAAGAPLEKEAPAAEVKKAAANVVPRASGDGEWEQVWVSKRLPGRTFVKKQEMLQALIEKDAEEAVRAKAGPLLDTLTGALKKRWQENAQLPPAVKGLPDAAQTTFREAANSHFEQAGDNDDEGAMKAGWGAVKNGWVKGADGTWTQKANQKSWLDTGLVKREYSTEERRKYAKQGVAMEDGSFPIPDKAALSDAVHAYGRAGNKPAARRHIIRRARALGAEGMIPEEWGVGRTKKFTAAAVTKLKGKTLEKHACLHFVADLLNTLAAVECLEEQCEFDGDVFRGMGATVTNVSPELQDRFGKLLVEFGDLISDILSEVLKDMSAEEEREAMERAAPAAELIKVGARHSKETLAVVSQAISALINAFGEDVVKPGTKRVGNDGSVDQGSVNPKGSEDDEKEVTVKPRRRVGQDHPEGGVPKNIGDIAPYKSLSHEDLIKVAVAAEARVEELEAGQKAAEAATEKVLTEVKKAFEALSAKLEKVENENGALRKSLDQMAGDVTQIRNTPMPTFATLRVTEKAGDRLGAYRGSEPENATRKALPSEHELRLAAERAQFNRMHGYNRRTEDMQ